MNHYLIIDNATQWTTKIIAVDDSGDIKEDVYLDSKIECPYLKEIFNQEIHFKNRKFGDQTYYGWTITRTDFNRIKRLASLFPYYQEYLKLGTT